LDDKLRALLDDAITQDGLLVFLTGAGISAESGIPTFRGQEGYWTVGSDSYHPQEMATNAAFQRMPREVWRWYLYRRSVCRAADPNPAHEALAALEQSLGQRFLLITQNVDGLHLRAGNTVARTYQIHGNIDYMRCAEACTVELFPLPDNIRHYDKDTPLTDEDFESLSCPECGGGGRPHVLWFDESYDEPLFRFESSLAAAGNAALLVTVGTSGATNLPTHVVRLAANSGSVVVDVNPADNPFSQIAAQLQRGYWAEGSAAAIVPEIAEALTS
jgi:NAD-dependent deacetylase